jgi:hypothetical protein
LRLWRAKNILWGLSRAALIHAHGCHGSATFPMPSVMVARFLGAIQTGG